jgi:hypothetical protein
LNLLLGQALFNRGCGKLVIQHGLSTWQASRVCKSLSSEGVELPTPSQSGVWRRVIKQGKLMKERIKKVLSEEKDYCLHFDGKKMNGEEYQVRHK